MMEVSLKNPLVRTKRMSYSAILGSIGSQDDWYIVDDHKVVTETSLISNNKSVFAWLHPNSVPYWVRITVANLCYENQSIWTDLFFYERSGTYNN